MNIDAKRNTIRRLLFDNWSGKPTMELVDKILAAIGEKQDIPACGETLGQMPNPHLCGLPKGHTGKHRCSFEVCRCAWDSIPAWQADVLRWYEADEGDGMSETPRTDAIVDRWHYSGFCDGDDCCDARVSTSTFARQLERELAEVSKKYNEILYAVAQKFPNESRHETALRCIREREQCSVEPEECKQNESQL